MSDSMAEPFFPKLSKEMAAEVKRIHAYQKKHGLADPRIGLEVEVELNKGEDKGKLEPVNSPGQQL